MRQGVVPTAAEAASTPVKLILFGDNVNPRPRGREGAEKVVCQCPDMERVFIRSEDAFVTWWMTGSARKTDYDNPPSLLGTISLMFPE